MSAIPTLSLTEAQALTALRAFLLSVVQAPTVVIRAENNRVPEPKGSNFIVMTPLFQERLETNETAYHDNIVVGAISGNTLAVSSVIRGTISVGNLLTDGNWPNTIAAGTVITAFGSGAGGTGSYLVAPSQSVASETIYAGVRADQVATKLTVQLDIHGPASGDNTKVIEALFRSEIGVQGFDASEPGYSVIPLYCGDARQAPFLNAEQQYEYRWSIDACVQINPVIGTPQQFADQIKIAAIEVDATYPP